MKRKNLQKNKISKKLEINFISNISFQIKLRENKMFTVEEIKKMEEVQIIKLQREFDMGILTKEEMIRKEIYVRSVARLRISQVSGR